MVVRRHLMMKYTQVSSKRRRRSFYTALTRWKSHARTFKATLQAVEGASLHDLAVNIRERQFLHEWRKLADAYYQRQLDGGELWASEQQRQSLKAWARSTLQKGGQAHSADMVRRRHERDHRNRAFQQWRHLASRLKHVEASPDLFQTNDSHKTTLKHLKWLPLSRRPDYKQEALTPIHTPSRSTGLLFPSSHVPVLRFTDPVAVRGRRHENSGALKSGIWKQGLSGRQLMPGHGDMATTTPETPVAAHVQYTSRNNPTMLDQAQGPLVDPIHMTSFRDPIHMTSFQGHAVQASSSIAAASGPRIGKEEVKMPRIESDRTTVLNEVSLRGRHARHSYARTSTERMRRWQSGVRTGIATPLSATEKTAQGRNKAEFT
ncbi:hypothetical protein E4U53_006481 [Claviceps sorghi]|nr:hypothetical protein E4U53_006481 [Claviceps sorghi]